MMAKGFGRLSTGVAIVLLSVTGMAAQATDLDQTLLSGLETCLAETAWERDVLNTSVVCFNAARASCADEVVACETELTAVFRKRSEALLDRLPGELESAPEFAKDRYLEILDSVETGARTLCDVVAEGDAVSCAYRAQALRLAKLRSLAAQVDPTLLPQ